MHAFTHSGYIYQTFVKTL